MSHNARLTEVPPSPIREVQSWLEGRTHPAGRPLLDVAQAEPDYAPAEELQEHLRSRTPESGFWRYTPVPGLGELRAALAADVGATYGVAPDPSEVLITAGCNQAFCLAASGLAAPGDEILLPIPYYFNHDMWLRAQGIVPKYLEPGPDMLPDVERAAALCTGRTRALVLISPNNPTGAVCPDALLQELFDLARGRGLRLILDETYRDFLPGEGPPHRLFERTDWPETLIHLYSFSKAFAMTGLRVGAVVTSAKLLSELEKLADCVAICAPRPGQEAALFALRRLGEWRRQKALDVVGRLSQFRRLMRSRETGFEVVACGAFFAYLRHPFDGEPSRQVARRLLEEQSLLCLAGSMFGPGQESFLRLAFANLPDTALPELVERLAKSGDA